MLDRVIPAADGLASRRAAIALLGAVLRRGRPLDEALAAEPMLANLAPRDRAFARAIVATTLRRLPHIDAILALFVARPIPDRQAVVVDGLRVAAAQILFLGTPAHAVVDTAVRLTGESSLTATLKGLVNAVTRKIATEGPGLVAAQDEARLALPDWLWNSWVAAYGEPLTRASASRLLADPPLDITPRRDPALWAERLGGVLLPTGTVRIAEPAGPVADLLGFADGAWWVQDAAAALPARLLKATEGQTVLDLCAAPGGKTAQLALTGASVTALDRSRARMGRLHENLTRLRLADRVTVVVGDAGDWRPPEPVDAVLLDAPCGATGTIRRHPDILRTKQPGEITAVTSVQDRLLAAAVEMLKPGGVLVYCVCSLEAIEGRARVDHLLANNTRVTLEPIAPDELGVGAEALITSDGDLRTLPAHFPDLGGLDGFFAARLRRRG